MPSMQLWNARVYPKQLLAPDDQMLASKFYKHDAPLRWVRAGSDAGARQTVAVFHGNAESAASVIRMLSAFGTRSVISFEYPPSLGEFAEFSKKAAASLLSDGRDVPFAVVGRSLGSAVALQVASLVRPHVCILISPFVSPARTVLPPHLAGMVDGLFDSKRFFDNGETIQRLLATRILIVSGTDDRVCPHDHAIELHRLAPLSELISIARASHNDMGGEDVAAIASFFERFG